ncbi:MAG: DnaB-like helicase C-terminal domain-containing protein, partial [Pseudomonadota bacterium]
LLLLDNDAGHLVFGIVQNEMFYDPVHARIFEVLKDHIDRGKLACPTTLRTFLGADEGLAELGGPDYLVRMMGAATAVAAAPDFARLIRDLYVRRAAIDVGHGIAERSAQFSFDQAADEIIDLAEGKLAQLRADTSSESVLHSYESAVSDAMNVANLAFQREGVPEISSGSTRIDDITNGWQRSNLIVLGARTSMGKTAVACSTAVSVAQTGTPDRPGRGVLFASFEMEPFELGQRFISLQCAREGMPIPYRDLAAGKMTEDQFSRSLEVSRDTSSLPIYTVGSNCREFGRLRGAIRQACKAFERQSAPLSLIIVDYVQLGVAAHLKDHKAQEVAFFARELKNLAAEYNVPVLALSQVKREVDDRKNRRPMLSDLRWAGEIEEAANQVGFIYRQAYYDLQDAKGEPDETERQALLARADIAKHRMEIVWEKNRGGPIGTSSLWCDLPTNRIEDEDPSRGPDPRQSDMDDFR